MRLEHPGNPCSPDGSAVRLPSPRLVALAMVKTLDSNGLRSSAVDKGLRLVLGLH